MAGLDLISRHFISIIIAPAVNGNVRSPFDIDSNFNYAQLCIALHIPKQNKLHIITRT